MTIHGWHTTSPARARKITREGLIPNPPRPVHSYDFVADWHEILYGPDVHPVYVALGQPVDLGLAHAHKIEQAKLQVLQVDLTGLELHIDVPLMLVRLPSMRPWMYDRKIVLSESRRASTAEQELLAELRRITGDARTTVFDTHLMRERSVRALICRATQTATVCEPIAPERILDCLSMTRALSACGARQVS